jgi:translation initiation factor 1
MDICPKCGLPLQACVCEEIAKTEQRIQIQTIKKKFGKVNTVISGFQDVDLKTIAKSLKQELACGGTAKDNVVELQGDHTASVVKALVKLGFSEDTIEKV